MKRNAWSRVVLFAMLAAVFILSACGVALPTNQKSTADVTGNTPAEKALSIATIVSQNNKGLLLVSDARIVQNGVKILIVDENTKKVQGMAPLWLLMGDAGADAASSMYGLLYSVYVTKPSSALAQQDADDTEKALADLLSLSAKTFLQGNTKEFSFIEIVVIYPSFNILLYYMPDKSIITERARGVAADWVTFAISHEIAAQQMFVAMGTPNSTPTPASKP